MVSLPEAADFDVDFRANSLVLDDADLEEACFTDAGFSTGRSTGAAVFAAGGCTAVSGAGATAAAGGCAGWDNSGIVWGAGAGVAGV